MSRGAIHVGETLANAIRARRAELGASTQALADQFEVEADAIAGIESGDGMIAAPTLVKLARALEVDLVWFIEREPSLLRDVPVACDLDAGATLLDAKEGLALLQAFAAIKDRAARETILKLAQQFASDSGNVSDECDET